MKQAREQSSAGWNNVPQEVRRTGHQAQAEGPLEGDTGCSPTEIGEEAEDVGTDVGRWQERPF